MITGKRESPPRILLTGLLILCAGAGGLAQNSNSGDLRGTVTDATGAVIPDVKVTIMNIDTGATRELVTNSAGLYDAVSLLPGRYRITFSKTGFEKVVREGITLEATLLTVDAQLTVGGTQQQIEVTAEATLLKTETAEQSTTFREETMQKLPNVGQNWGNFMKLLPGSSGAPTSSQGAANPGIGVAVNGNLPFYANFLADGASSVLPHSANADISTFETLSEVQVQTSTFSAQYGIGGAVFNQISKGGTNRFHGSAYEYLQNNFFNSRSFFSPKVGNLRYDNFGGSVSGPIIRNKLFFYFNVDKTINNSTSYPFATYPRADERAGDFSNPIFPIIYDPTTRMPFPNNKITQIDPVAAKILPFFPTPNLPGYVNNYQIAQTTTSPFLKFFGRIDYNLSDKNRVTFSITQRDNPAFYPSADCPLDCFHGDVDSYNAQVSDVWSISPTTVNEFRFGFTRQGNWFAPETLNQGYPQKWGIQYAKADIAPSINITGGVIGGTSLGPGTNAVYVENSFEPSDIVTMIRGRHILHFGGEVLAFQDNSTPWGNINAANMTFSGAFTKQAPFGSGGLGFADFLLGQVSSWSASVTPNVGMREKNPQLFFQDDFKLRPNLTINLGLRYQIQGGWGEVANRIGIFDPTIINPVTNTPGAMWFGGANGRSTVEKTIYNIFLPRVGFAWSPSSNWVVRGGYGMYSYGWSMDTYAGNAEGFGTNSSGNLTNTDQVAPIFILSATNPALPYVQASHNPGAFNGQGVNYYPYNTPVGKISQWSLSVQRQLPFHMVGEIAYTGSHGWNLPFPADLNQVPVDKLGQGQSARPFPQFATISGGIYNGWSNYHSAQFSLNKRMSSGLSFGVNYTRSRFLDTQDSAGWGSRGGSQLYQSAYYPGQNYALSNFDVPNAFKGLVTYQLPFGKGRSMLRNNRAMDALFGGWQTSTIFIAQSGAPFTPTVSGTNNSGALSTDGGVRWYPNCVGDPSVSNPTIQQWFNPAAFAAPAKFTFGNCGRNILRGPRLSDIDFELGKNFALPHLGEASHLELRIDATNILNHTSFGQPNSSIGNTNAGVITGTTVSGRTIQLGVRLAF